MPAQGLRFPALPGRMWARATFSMGRLIRGRRRRRVALLSPCTVPHRPQGRLPTPPRNHGPHPALYSGGEKRQQERNKKQKKEIHRSRALSKFPGWWQQIRPRLRA